MDATDLWWASPAGSESGWGANVMQQGNTLFITMFVYGSDGTARWFVAPDVEFSSGTASGPIVYTGQLYRTTGPWFGAATFPPSGVVPTAVGTATFTLNSVTSATLTYSADGVSVTKNLVRQTWRVNDLTGSYLGASVGTYSPSCASAGYKEEPATITLSTPSGGGFSMLSITATTSCTYSGSYTQDGQMGRASGTFTCNGINGASGTTDGNFNAVEMQGNDQGVTARADISFSNGCSWSGRIGGITRGNLPKF